MLPTSYLSGQENCLTASSLPCLSCLTASSGERVCFTSTRRFEVFADQPSPRHDATRLLCLDFHGVRSTASEKSTSRVKKKRDPWFWSAIGYLATWSFSPFIKYGFAVETPQKSAGQKTNNKMLATNTLAGQRSNCAHPFFSRPTFHEKSSNRSHRDPTWINRLPALTYLATQMLLNTIKYCRLQAVAFQAELLQFR